MDRLTGRTPHPGQGLRGREEAWPACGLQRGPMHPTFHPLPQRMGCGLDGRCKAVPGESGAQLAAQMGRLRSGEGRASGWWLSRLGLRGEGVAEGPQGLPAQLSAVSARCAAGVCVRDRCVRGGLRSSSLETEEGACNPHCQTPAPYQPPSFAEPQPPPTWTLPQMCSSALLAGPPAP